LQGKKRLGLDKQEHWKSNKEKELVKMMEEGEEALPTPRIFSVGSRAHHHRAQLQRVNTVKQV